VSNGFLRIFGDNAYALELQEEQDIFPIFNLNDFYDLEVMTEMKSRMTIKRTLSYIQWNIC
jgi:hypothetical protein